MIMKSAYRVTLRFDDEQAISCQVSTSETIMSSFDRQGYVLHSSCKSGGCGVCLSQVKEGNFQYLLPMSTNKLKTVDEGTAFLCRATPVTDLVIQVPTKWVIKKSSLFSDVLRDISVPIDIHQGE
jgi:ferredoxin